MLAFGLVHFASGDPTEEILTATFEELFTDAASDGTSPTYTSPDFYVTVNASGEPTIGTSNFPAIVSAS